MGTDRYSLLRILADGRIHSVEHVCRTLGLSEIGVRKLARELARLGARVCREAGSGLRLERPMDLYDPELLEDQLKAFPGLCLELLEECPSTNTALVARARAGAAHGSVLVCEHQSAGRGRRGNAWISTVGESVTFSILWRFPRGAGALAGLGLAVAVAAVRGLEALGVRDVSVKWPNDLFYGGGKLGGILVETSGEAAGPVAAVIGVGVNVHLSDAARARIGGPAVDIAATGMLPSRTATLAGLVTSVASSLELFSRKGFAVFREAWLERHAWQGRRVVLSQADRSVAEGELVGIADDGALELASERGIQRFHNGELSLRLG